MCFAVQTLHLTFTLIYSLSASRECVLNTGSQRQRSFPCSPALISALCLPQWPLFSIAVLHSPATAVIKPSQSDMAASSDQTAAVFFVLSCFYY